MDKICKKCNKVFSKPINCSKKAGQVMFNVETTIYRKLTIANA